MGCFCYTQQGYKTLHFRIMKITNKHNNYIRLCLENPKMTKEELAEQVGVSRQTIWEWENDEDFTAHRDKEVRKMFGKLSAKAIGRMEQLMYAKNENVALNACKDILDRGGFKPVEEVQTDYTPLVMAARKLMMDD